MNSIKRYEFDGALVSEFIRGIKFQIDLGEADNDSDGNGHIGDAVQYIRQATFWTMLIKTIG